MRVLVNIEGQNGKFYPYVNGKDFNAYLDTLSQAIVCAIAYRQLGFSEAREAGRYACKLLDLNQGAII